MTWTDGYRYAVTVLGAALLVIALGEGWISFREGRAAGSVLRWGGRFLMVYYLTAGSLHAAVHGRPFTWYLTGAALPAMVLLLAGYLLSPSDRGRDLSERRHLPGRRWMR